MISTNVPVCVPLTGLRACIDRVVLPAPECARCPENHGPKVTYTTGPLLEALDVYDHGYHHDGCRRHHRYKRELHKNIFDKTIQNKRSTVFPNKRFKRQIPIIQHGYKFVMNMLPPFMKDPLLNAVNIMALSNPEAKKAKYAMRLPTKKKYFPGNRETVPLTLKDKILRKLQNRGKDLSYFLKKQGESTSFRPRGSFGSEEESLEDSSEESWIREYRARDILEDYSPKNLRIPKNSNQLSQYEILQNMREKTIKNRPKRSIIMDSEELSVPLYQLKLDDFSGEEYPSLENDHDYMEKRILQKKRSNYHNSPSDAMIKKAIKDELRKFKKINKNDQFGYNKMAPHSPIFHLLSFPLKIFRNFGNANGSPLMTVPNMIVGTKKYFREFGRNFKKHALNFASDIIGDFDHESLEHQLKDVFKPTRYKRQIFKNDDLKSDVKVDTKENKTTANKTDISQNVNNDTVDTGVPSNMLEPDYTIVFGNPEMLENFQNDPSLPNTSSNELKNFHKVLEDNVRKKRYIVKVVDEDEVEEYLRQKLSKLYNVPPKRRKPQFFEERYSEEETWSTEEINNMYKRRNKYEDENESLHKLSGLEKVRPKLIIDNKGLPFMEMNGFKRPILLNNHKEKSRRYANDEIVGGSQFIPVDSSEEVNREKIDHVIGYAKHSNIKQAKINDIPINIIKKKMSDLLQETDILVHIDFWKYHDIYDDLLEIQYIKASIVQDWKKIVMEKRINDLKAKINLLGKFKSMQHIKDIAVKNVVNAMSKETRSSFILGEFVKMLMKLHKLQCGINKIVGCFEEKIKMGTKFDMQNEIKFIDYLSKLNFAGEKTRNDMIAKLKDTRDIRLQENIKLLDKLKKSLVEEDEPCIQDEANLIWEIKNIEKMRMRTIDEMHQKLIDGYRVKKHMKILFDLTKRLQACEAELRADCKNMESNETSEPTEYTKNQTKKNTIKKFNMDEFKKKMQEKMEKYKELLQEKKDELKRKYKKESDEDE